MSMPRVALLALLTFLWSLAAPPATADGIEEEVARMARIGSAGSPSLSPDGDWVAFVSDLTGVPQVWKVETTGGFPVLLTPLEDPIGAVEWSPEGDWLAFSLAPGGGMNSQIHLVRPDGTGLHRVSAGGRVNHWLGEWSDDGRLLAFSSNRIRADRMDAYLYAPAAESTHLVAENPGVGGIADLSRDGRWACLSRLASRGDNDLVLLDREAGTETVLTPHEGPGSFGACTFAPNGRTIYLTSNQHRDRVALGRIELGADGRPGPITHLRGRDDAELADLVLSHDGSTLVLLWNVAGRNELELLGVDGLEPLEVPELPAPVAGGLELSADGRLLVAVLSGATRPRDVWVLDLSRRRWRQLTRSPHAGVDLGELVAPELVRYPAHDGLELTGWLYRPPGADGPAPYVLSFHGGPEGQERPRFRPVYQALLARGIGVFAPNVRGSAGFGKRFVNLDNGALRFDAIRDIASSARYLTGHRLADPERLGIMGGSYGGYMVMAGLTDYPELFAAGANLFGVVNFHTFFANTEPWMAAISTVEYGDPATEAELLRELSPIHRVDRVVAPTLVLHGANDTNVPVVEAEQVVSSLRERGVPVEYILFEDEGHGFEKTRNRITAAVAVVRWFERYLKASELAGPEPAR